MVNKDLEYMLALKKKLNSHYSWIDQKGGFIDSCGKGQAKTKLEHVFYFTDMKISRKEAQKVIYDILDHDLMVLPIERESILNKAKKVHFGNFGCFAGGLMQDSKGFEISFINVQYPGAPLEKEVLLEIDYKQMPEDYAFKLKEFVKSEINQEQIEFYLSNL